MSAPCTSVCSPWADSADVCAACSDYSIDEALMDDFLQLASDVLFELSGRRFPGSCEETVRPCSTRQGGGVLRNVYPSDALIDGIYWDGTCGCTSQCGGTRLSEVDLGYSPLTSIVEVKVDGDVLDPSLYRIDDFRWLVRLADADGTNPGWPCCQDLNLDSDQENTFEVTFTYGVTPPIAGVKAAAELACQLYLACDDSDDCKLPKGVRSVARQGVVIDMVDPQAFLKEGKVGLYLVDLFLTTYPRRQPMSVMSPDVGTSVRRVGT